MKYRLIAMDLDGTLNNDAKEITPRTYDALMRAQQAGVRLALASARPLPGLYKERDILEMRKYRQQYKAFVAEGPKLVGELLPYSTPLYIAATKDWLDANRHLLRAVKEVDEVLERMRKEVRVG